MCPLRSRAVDSAWECSSILAGLSHNQGVRIRVWKRDTILPREVAARIDQPRSFQSKTSNVSGGAIWNQTFILSIAMPFIFSRLSMHY